ncbi:hypothetical protein LZ32DRAFT_611290 [Colletotrichum eremochloae]|nr:hypothetical protein LZ32DRAFT_611290 [Colletotrichum eremochloae]
MYNVGRSPPLHAWDPIEVARGPMPGLHRVPSLRKTWEEASTKRKRLSAGHELTHRLGFGCQWRGSMRASPQEVTSELSEHGRTGDWKLLASPGRLLSSAVRRR